MIFSGVASFIKIIGIRKKGISKVGRQFVECTTDRRLLRPLKICLGSNPARDTTCATCLGYILPVCDSVETDLPDDKDFKESILFGVAR
ncbi:MAG: hypothetical protein SRB2_03666 [Desulfobacteraceae bacterium Eth-SRB2]|nr:MAG: hypothetical protein SRB2_03666 [Desulfobacteraceae bacterium Eth-SRB2]